MKNKDLAIKQNYKLNMKWLWLCALVLPALQAERQFTVWSETQLTAGPAHVLGLATTIHLAYLTSPTVRMHCAGLAQVHQAATGANHKALFAGTFTGTLRYDNRLMVAEEGGSFFAVAVDGRGIVTGFHNLGRAEGTLVLENTPDGISLSAVGEGWREELHHEGGELEFDVEPFEDEEQVEDDGEDPETEDPNG